MSTPMNANPHTTIIDMTPDGGFREPQRAGWNIRATTGWTTLAAIIGAGVLGLVLVVWLAITVLPIVIALAVVGVVVSRLRGRRRRFIMRGPFARRF